MSKHSPEPSTSVYVSAEGGFVRPLRCRNSLLIALRCLFRHGRRAAPSPFVINYRFLRPSLMRRSVSARFVSRGHR